MKGKVVIPVVFILLGILVILAPTVIFPVCAEVMACTYTKKVEIGLGILLILLGAVSIFLDERVRLGISISLAGIGALIIAAPLGWIGVCGSNMMTCRIATRPLLLVLGILTVAAAAIQILLILKRNAGSDIS